MAMVNGFLGQAVSRVISEMDGAEHSRDRLKAAEMLMRAGGVLRANDGGSPTVNVGSQQTLAQGATMEQIRAWFRDPSADS